VGVGLISAARYRRASAGGLQSRRDASQILLPQRAHYTGRNGDGMPGGCCNVILSF